MQQIGYQIPNPDAAATLLEKILSRKCKVHEQFACEYLHVMPSEFSPRLCWKCMEERHISPNEYVSIRLLLEATSNTIFRAYPKLNDKSIPQKLQQVKGTSEKVLEEVSSFFDYLKSAVSMAIEKQKSDLKDNLASFSACYQEIFDSLAQISQIEQFQEIVKKDNDNEELLKQFIYDQDLKANKNTQTINNKLLEYQMIYERFSLTEPQNKLDKIIKLVEKIQFFPTNIQSYVHLSSQQRQRQQYQQEQPQQQQQQQQQQQEQQQQQQLSTSSEIVYKEYVSLVKQGFDQLLLLSYSQSSLSYKSKSLYRYRYNYTEYRYADNYDRWLEFSEGEREQQLRVLKTELEIYNKRKD